MSDDEERAMARLTAAVTRLAALTEERASAHRGAVVPFPHHRCRPARQPRGSSALLAALAACGPAGPGEGDRA